MQIRTDVIGSKILHNQRLFSDQVQKEITRLSTGLRINSASDDSAGLAISERLKSQINGSNQAKRNIQDSISLANIADGGLSSIQDQLQRTRELIIEAQNGTVSNSDKSSIQQEINQMLLNIDNTAKNQNFNGISVLNENKGISLSNGSAVVNVGNSNLYDSNDFTLESVVTPKDVTGLKELITKEVSYKYRIDNGRICLFVDQNGVGPWESVLYWNANLQPNQTYDITVTHSSTDGTSEAFVNGVSLGKQTVPKANLGINNIPVQLGGYNNGSYSFNGTFQEARIYNKVLTSNEIQQNYNGLKTSDGLVGEWVFNNDSGTVVKDTSGNGMDANVLLKAPIWTNGISIHDSDSSGSSIQMDLSEVKSSDIGVTGLDVNDDKALEKLDYAIDRVSQERGKYGSYINTLNFQLNNLDSKITNTQLANQRISESDIDAETSELTKNQIKIQTSLQMLQKNNANRQSILSLLQN